jgi:hypothetical protein
MVFKRTALLCASVFFALAVGGCIFSPEDDNGGGGTTTTKLPPALTQAELMGQLSDVYEDMDFRGYTQVLDPAFKIILKPETISEFGLENNYFTYAQDTRITEKMFSGDPASETVPGITSISVLQMTNLTPWEDSQNTEFPDASYAKYFVHFEFWQGSGNARQKMTVEGEIDFYLSATPITYEGKERLQYKMVGQVDRTNG